MRIAANCDFKRPMLNYVRCSVCDRNGYFFTESSEECNFIVCKKCGWKTARAHCVECEIGWQLDEVGQKQTDIWECPECSKEFKLPDDFYNKPAYIYFEEDLPEGLLDSFHRNRGFKPKPSLVDRIKRYISLYNTK